MTFAIQIWPCSDEALALCPAGFTREMLESPIPMRDYRLRTYPFCRMQIGHSFAVEFGIDKEKQRARLRVAVSNANKQYNRRFVLLEHEKHSQFEVARIE